MIGKHFLSWSKGLWQSMLGRPDRAPLSVLPADLLGLLPEKKASVLRSYLKSAFADNRLSGESFRLFMDRAREAAWDSLELEKLAAYGEFFSGANAAAYQRVVSGRLAEADFDILMTACVHCYLADRFEEGYALLAQFKPERAETMDDGDYLAFAGYLALAAGKDIREATHYFDLALDRGIRTPLLAVNSYPIYSEAGLHDRTEQVRRLIYEHFSDDPEAIYALACAELSRDYYGEGFRLAEIRYQIPEAGRFINTSLIGKPRWQGEDIRGKKLLVHAEQGLGDIVMIARYLPLLQDKGAEIILECKAEAIPLLAPNYPDVQMVAGELAKPVTAPFDLWCGAMSLPFIFNTLADSVPATQGYLRAPPEQVAYWRGRVAELAQPGTPRIGIAWSGNPKHRADKRRSMSFERIACFIEACPDHTFFTLQTAVPPVHPANLFNFSEEMLTLADTAALIQEMDLVITVDTSIVHLAGALGKATWLLLPRRYEWRWSLEGEDNNWYDSVRVLRQAIHGDWSSLLDDVFGRRLPEFVAGFRGNKAW